MNRLLFLVAFILLSCDTESDFVDRDPDPEIFNFFNGFENAQGDVNNLLGANPDQFSGIQIQNSSGGSNMLSLVSSPVVSGSTAMRVDALATNGTLSKADIEKADLHASVGSTISIAASYYIEGTADLTDLLLADLECCSCWDPNVPNNQCPGVRLMLKPNGYLGIERGKILGSTLEQTQVSLPRDTWFRLRWESVLDSTDAGINRLYVDDVLVLEAAGANMPNPEDFAALFAAQGITFQLQEPLIYERVQLGATANPTAQDVVMYIDDVEIQIMP